MDGPPLQGQEDIAERDLQFDKACSEKERLTREGGAAEKDRDDVQTQCDRVLKMGHEDGRGSQGT
jgi:hypothetical protein